MTNSLQKLFITCPAGLENLLRVELEALGLKDLRETVTGVLCRGEPKNIYAICLWSRFANRVLLLLAEENSGNAGQIQQLSKSIPWEEHLDSQDSIRVDFNGHSPAIRHSQYGAQLIKDGVVDRFQERGEPRPNVDLAEPDHRINVRLSKRKIYISLDISGESLHKRGYRVGQGLAPIKENLAAALLTRAKWPGFAKAQRPFVDPMCGSATFLIEAVYMAADIAPGLLRDDYGFLRWKQFQKSRWQELQDQAEERKVAGLRALTSEIVGCEIDPRVAKQAELNIAKAGLSDKIRVIVGELPSAKQHLNEGQTGLLLCNPPYGMRLGEQEKLPYDYRQLAQLSKTHFPGWTLGILSSSAELLSETRMRFDKKYRIFNGPIPCELRLFSIRTDDGSSQTSDGDDSKRRDRLDTVRLSDGAQMVANRLRKNQAKLAKWADKNSIECYRVYDADLPEYAAAIDVYQHRLHIQEYQAPKTIEVHKAESRYKDLVKAAKHVFRVENQDVFLKVRKKNKGVEQYQKQAPLEEQDFIRVKEGKATLLINLKSYLDTGLFLDHRPLRNIIEKESAGKRFLNLFSYTSSASVRAILGGASSSTSVDMSNTYVKWSRLNFEANNIRSNKHEIVRADVRTWLKQCRSGYDLIMLDPPSFSNSKKMDESFDVQRDHRSLITRCMELLNSGGTLYFSNNFRKFRLDEVISDQFNVEDISDATIDQDFRRNTKIHTCFKITHKSQ